MHVFLNVCENANCGKVTVDTHRAPELTPLLQDHAIRLVTAVHPCGIHTCSKECAQVLMKMTKEELLESIRVVGERWPHSRTFVCGGVAAPSR